MILDKQEYIARLKRYAQDTSLPGVGTGRAGQSDERIHKLWMEALRNQEILFGNGVSGRVHYNDFHDIDFTGPEINNQEWRATLNRFFWLEHLSSEYEKTHDEFWARLAHDSIEAWLDYRSYRGDETYEEVWKNYGDNTLSVSIRLGQTDYEGWFGALPYFMDSPYFDDAFISRMLDSLADQMRFLYRNNRKHGNFRISELDTMMFISEMIPGFEQYRDYAVRSLNETFRSQVEDDGSHQEHTGGYHDWMCRVFTRYAILAKNRPELGLVIDAERLSRMYQYMIAHHTPDGREWGINDEGRWHPDATPADLDALRDKYNRVREFLGLEPDNASVPAAYPNAGQYYFHAANGDALTLDATNFGGWHTHNGRGSLLFYHGDRLQLCDPGSLNYERSDPFFLPGRMTGLHNTVTVNGLVQNQKANAHVPFWKDTPEYSFFQCDFSGGYTNHSTHHIHNSFDKCISCAGRHIRTVFWLKGKFAVVLDTLEVSLPEYDYAAHWQMLDDPVEFDAAGRSLHTATDGANLMIASPWSDGAVEAKLYCGDFEKKLGYIAVGTNAVSSGKPAPMLSVEGHNVGDVHPHILTVLAPFDGKHAPAITAEGCIVDEALQIALTVDGEQYHFAAELSFLENGAYQTQVGERGKLRSDGKAAAVLPDGTSFCYGGTFAEI